MCLRLCVSVCLTCVRAVGGLSLCLLFDWLFVVVRSIVGVCLCVFVSVWCFCLVHCLVDGLFVCLVGRLCVGLRG